MKLRLLPLLLFFAACKGKNDSNKTSADLLVYNATIYTVDSTFSTAEAFAFKREIVDLSTPLPCSSFTLPVIRCAIALAEISIKPVKITTNFLILNGF